MWSDFWFVALVVVALAGCTLAGFYYSRDRRDRSPFDSSSAGIAIQKNGWFVGMVKRRHIRDNLRNQARVGREVADYRKSSGGGGAVGDLERLMREAQDEQKGTRR